MKFATKYDYKKVSGFHFQKPSLTDQTQAYQCDINNVVKGLTLYPQTAKEPQFGHEFDPSFYEKALNTVASAKSEFEKLPAVIRREFDNDPKKFISFIDNPSEENAKKGIKLGIFNDTILERFKPVETTSQVILDGSQTDKITPAVSE